jgi:hypothetical protein
MTLDPRSVARAPGASSATCDPTQWEKLLLIGLEADLWHDKDVNTFATVTLDGHQENFSKKSTGAVAGARCFHGKRCKASPSNN